jgi:hypothetical protein
MRTHDIARTIAPSPRGFPLPRRTFLPVARRAVLPTLALLFAAASCRGGCARKPDAAATVQGRLALLPLPTRVVVALDFARLRASPAAAKLAALAQQNAGDQQQLDDFARRTGLDPIQHLDSLLVGFPEDARARGEFGLVLRAQRLDQARLIAYVRDQLQKTGDDLVATPHGRFVLWAARRDPDVAGFFLDEHTFVLGAGGWAPRLADLAASGRPADSAATNLDLVRLAETAASGHAIWAAAIVPAETRRTLQADPNFAHAAAVMDLAVGVDLGAGLQAQLVSDVATTRDAQALAAKVQETMRDAKRNPQVLMLGLGPYLDGITARASEQRFELRATLSESQLDDLLGRLAALVALARQGRAPGFP